jgi:hypothetical protein
MLFSRSLACSLCVQELIDRANKKNTLPTVSFSVLDLTNHDAFRSFVSSYFASLPCPSPSTIPTPPCRFSLVLVLSLTMWIHINHGDDGLVAFLERITQVADHIILEPQPWKCCTWCADRPNKLYTGDIYARY